MKKLISLFVLLLLLLVNCEKKIDDIQKYKNLTIIDVHFHGSYTYKSIFSMWEKYNIKKIVLFGAISEPKAINSDKMSWIAYNDYPDRFYPFFAGFDVHNPDCLDIIKKNFETGYYGIGEFVAASSYSPVTSKLAWKGLHPMDGFFPQIYELCEKYKSPILLHIDPPFGFTIEKFKEALNTYKNTIFIFAHANTYNSPDNLSKLLKKHDNLYIDFFAGFTAYNKDSNYSLNDYVLLINEYPDKFFVSTDSGYDIGLDKAYEAMYELFDKLDYSLVEKIAYKNFQAIIEAEPITQKQINIIQELSKKFKKNININELNKKQANELIIQYQK